MRFAHMADCHIGSWREPKLNSMSIDAFAKAIGICIQEKVDFILISGDLFNNPVPSIDKLKSTVHSLKKAKDAGIQVYGIPGSHDYSPSGKTMIDVLEEAGLFKNVCRGSVIDGKLFLRFTEDAKTKVKLTGIIGRKGMLDRKFYEALDLRSLEDEPGKKIFLFHTLLTELKPENLSPMESQEVSLLPKGFYYYAGGHVHIVKSQQIAGYGQMAYPGPLFPNSFSELEELGRGGFYIVEDDNPRFIPIEMKKLVSIRIDAEKKDSSVVSSEIETAIGHAELDDSIVTLRAEGTLGSGKRSDIDFKQIFSRAYEDGAYIVMKNTAKLSDMSFEEIKIEARTPKEIEERIIHDQADQIKITGIQNKELALELLTVLDEVKLEGETVSDYTDRLTSSIKKLLNL